MNNSLAGQRRKRRWLAGAVLLLLLAATLRLVQFGRVPPGLAQDEVLNADIAQSILAGRHALFFREGFGHEPLYHYLAAPFQAALGDNIVSIRLPAFFLGLLLVAAAMRWSRREFGPVAGLLAGAWLALSWWPVIFSRIGLRPILEPLLLLGMAWFWRRRPWLAGIFLGLSLYSYTPARLALLIPPLYLASQWRLRRRLCRRLCRRLRRGPLLILGTSLLLALPLALVLRADPSLQERVHQLSGPVEALRSGDARPLLQATVDTLAFFSFKGEPRGTYMLPGRPLFDPLTALLFYAGLAWSLWQWRQERYAFLLIWLGVGLLPSALTPQAPSSVRLVGAMPPVYAMPALAAAALWARARPWPAAARTALLLALLALLGGNLWRTWGDGFGRWAQSEETARKYQTVFRDMARYWQGQAGQGLVLADDWVDPIDDDSLRRNLGWDPEGRWVQQGRALVFPRTLPAQLLAPEYAPPDPRLLAAAGIPPEPLFRSPGFPSFAAWPLASQPPRPAGQGVNFGGLLTLLGSQWMPAERAATAGPALVTFWRVEAPLPPDLSTFLHLVDGAEQIVAQFDGLDAAAWSLRPGDVVVQLHPLAWPQPLPAGVRVALGLYTRGDGRRLLHAGDPPDRLWLPMPPGPTPQARPRRPVPSLGRALAQPRSVR